MHTQGKQRQSLRTFLDNKIFATEEDRSINRRECLTLQIELPGLCVFTIELQDLATYYIQV